MMCLTVELREARFVEKKCRSFGWLFVVKSYCLVAFLPFVVFILAGWWSRKFLLVRQLWFIEDPDLNQAQLLFVSLLSVNLFLSKALSAPEGPYLMAMLFYWDISCLRFLIYCLVYSLDNPILLN